MRSELPTLPRHIVTPCGGVACFCIGTLARIDTAPVEAELRERVSAHAEPEAMRSEAAENAQRPQRT